MAYRVVLAHHLEVLLPLNISRDPDLRIPLQSDGVNSELKPLDKIDTKLTTWEVQRLSQAQAQPSSQL
ncbi:unnamed protein product [Cyberlindnera jadinii]|uniref:Uncharacterized protein n=1 Tax=Cyberlindnera jadinii (strain ATCC 18201 / CBS 1600 / BCRC 20928 / JCM 3617 / NBRC 0987 / NRRL Y-1542) TaxID=983966 RepID=A0A0H5BZD3_CYBJN|nr:unnamed protein product [Cyberlindnera jadinii]